MRYGAHIFVTFCYLHICYYFLFHAPATPQIYTLSLHDALPISEYGLGDVVTEHAPRLDYFDALGVLKQSHAVLLLGSRERRSEEHTSELQSRFDLVCRLLLEKKKNPKYINNICTAIPLSSCVAL